MIRLHAKQKFFSIKDEFTYLDENEQVVYSVKGKAFSWVKKLWVSNAVGEEVAFITEKFWTFLPHFFIEQNGTLVCEVKKDWTWVKQRYSVNPQGWVFRGDFWNHEYEILEGDRVVATISKKWLTWSDTYEIRIERPEDQLLVCCLVLVMDITNARAASAAASSANAAN